MRALPALALVVIHVASAATARAETEFDLDPSLRLGARAVFASASMGRLGGSGGGFGVAASKRAGPVVITGEFDQVWIAAEDEASSYTTTARSSRGRLLAQLALLEYQTARYRGGMMLSAGLGGEWIRVTEGAQLRRDFVTFGMDALHGYARTDRSIINLDLSWRFDLARPPDAGKLTAGCAGPCDAPTPTTAIDMSLSMVLSLRWGPIGPEVRR